MQINNEQYQMTDDKEQIRRHSKDIKALLAQSYWAKERTLETIHRSIEQSLCFSVFDTIANQMIAFARVVTDYSTMYYICDVIVDENYRGKGFGKRLIHWIVNEEEKLKGMYGMLLTSDAQGLYSQYGFSEYQQTCMCKFK